MKKTLPILIGTLLVLSALPYSAFTKQNGAQHSIMHNSSENRPCCEARSSAIVQVPIR